MAIAKKKKTNHERNSNALSYKEKKKKSFFQCVICTDKKYDVTDDAVASSQWIFGIEKKSSNRPTSLQFFAKLLGSI